MSDPNLIDLPASGPDPRDVRPITNNALYTRADVEALIEIALAAERKAAELRSTRTPPPAPDGMVVVPAEPTEEMLVMAGKASDDECNNLFTRGHVGDDVFRAVYRAMLSAATQQGGGW